MTGTVTHREAELASDQGHPAAELHEGVLQAVHERLLDIALEPGGHHLEGIAPAPVSDHFHFGRDVKLLGDPICGLAEAYEPVFFVLRASSVEFIKRFCELNS